MEIFKEAGRRQQICKACDEIIPTSIGWKCKECGCMIRPKSMIPISNCPLGKWELEND